jgi:hypothetical protein
VPYFAQEVPYYAQEHFLRVDFLRVDYLPRRK